MTNFQLLINKSIKNLRIQTGLSQEKFSEKCGISTEGYRNLEHNRYSPQPATIDKICKTFNINPIELLEMGMSCSNKDIKQNIMTKLDGLNNKQLELVSDFITLIKSY